MLCVACLLLTLVLVVGCMLWFVMCCLFMWLLFVDVALVSYVLGVCSFAGFFATLCRCVFVCLFVCCCRCLVLLVCVVVMFVVVVCCCFLCV